MADPKPVAKSKPSLSTTIAELLDGLDSLVREQSKKRTGVANGNVPPNVISEILAIQYGLEPTVCAALSRIAYRRHEDWRFNSKKGKKK